jgi:ubiquinone/menaquinone biosynthesis C-methylase UbiE
MRLILINETKLCLCFLYAAAIAVDDASGLSLKVLPGSPTIIANEPSDPSKLRRPNDRRQFLSAVSFVTSNLICQTELSLHPCNALTPRQAETDYDVYAADYDTLDGGSVAELLGIQQARLELIKQAKGKVLEIGVGTGLNLQYYDATKVTSLTLVDVSQNMLDQAKDRFASDANLQSVSVKLIQADATSELVSIFGESSFDTVIDTFSLCVMGNKGARKCLQQVEGMVQPDTGRILLLENNRSDNPLLGMYQDVTADAAASAGGKGCVYNQNVDALLRETNLEVLDSQSYAAGLFKRFVCRRKTKSN